MGNSVTTLKKAVETARAYYSRKQGRDNTIRELQDSLLTADQRKAEAIKALDMTAYQAISKELDGIPAKIEALKAEAAADQDPTGQLPELWKACLPALEEQQRTRLANLDKIREDYKAEFVQLLEAQRVAAVDLADIREMVPGAVLASSTVPEYNRVIEDLNFVFPGKSGETIRSYYEGAINGYPIPEEDIQAAMQMA